MICFLLTRVAFVSCLLSANLEPPTHESPIHELFLVGAIVPLVRWLLHIIERGL